MTNKSNIKPKQTIVTNNPECQVCGESPAGWHCGTITCEACKKFFLRKLKEGVSDLKCSHGLNACVITKNTRTNCQACRFNRCLSVGMRSPDEDKEVRTETADYNGIQCHVCNDAASGLHFGAFTCEGCKGFFRRMMNEQKVPRCDNDGKCDITNKNRNSCRACRFKKCLEVGMDLKSIKIGRQSNLFKKRLREVAKDNSLIGSASALTSVPICIGPCSSSELQTDIKIEDDFEPFYRDLIKEIFLAHEKSLETHYNPKFASPIQFLENNYQKCKTFLESLQFYREFDESDRKLILNSSIHPMQLVHVLTDSNTPKPNYFESSKVLEDLSVYLPTFCMSKINDDLTSSCELIRELKLDSKEIIIYKAHLAFHSVDIRKTNKNEAVIRNAKRLKEIQTILLKTLQRFLFARRNENESSLVLIQLMDIIQEIGFDLKRAYDKDLNELRGKGFLTEYNLLKQYF